jgi:hypothetical protein
LPETEAKGAVSAANVVADEAIANQTNLPKGKNNMANENKNKALDEADLPVIQKMIADALAARDAEAEAEKAANNKVEAAVEKALTEERAKNAAAGRLTDGQAPYQAKFSDTWKYDNLDPADNALLIEVLESGKKSGQSSGATPAALKALAHKIENSKDELYQVSKNAMRSKGIKANELNYSTQASYGDEWVGVAYSTRLWEAIRNETFVGEKLMAGAIELPQGHESITLPLEGSDLTFYKVAQATGNTSGRPDVTVTASKLGTASKSLTLAKMGARGVWSGEMEEDSLIPFVANLRRQIELGAAEQLEHAIIDGDTATGASVSVNDVAGTPSGTEVFLLVDGFRKSPLITTTANSRSAGALTSSDFLETVKLMGLGGRNAVSKDKVEFILDLHTAWKALELPEVLTRDVFANPTIENGELTSIFGYKVRKSAFMHYANQDATYGLKANTSGKIDLDTASNNTTGSILAVRYDQWQMGLRRRMTIETQRIPEADATQIVALIRFGLTQRDTEASAISYGVTL